MPYRKNAFEEEECRRCHQELDITLRVIETQLQAVRQTLRHGLLVVKMVSFSVVLSAALIAWFLLRGVR